MLDITALSATNTATEIGHAAETAVVAIRQKHRTSRWAAPAAVSALAFYAGVSTAFDGAIVGPLMRQAMKHVFYQPVGGGVALAATISVLAGRRAMRAWRQRGPAPARDELRRASDIAIRHDNAAAGLVRLGDKKLLFSDCGQAFIMFGCRGRSMVALFDPVGPRHLWPSLVLKFRAEAERLMLRPVFYQVSSDFLPVAVETGMKPYKIGEEAVLDLTAFSLAGGDWLKLRRSINRAERDGLSFEMLVPEAVPAVMGELARVSDLWLSTQNASEKGFSLGTFRNDYVASTPVAVIRVDGHIVAFANILTTESGHAFIDLMRSLPGVHRGAMDLLFVRIMEHLKQAGYFRLNLGMAPLSGLSDHASAPLWNRIGNQVFEKGERFYNFKGVKTFKSKFDPEWQPRYLIAGGLGLPVSAMLDVTLLIGGGLRGVFRRS
ncbi:phosphatidylglycerol lysyltransferase domain-containing protein [Rhizobium sp. C4]|uniref:phosphatidylglycerol lysyltransferase domain-containing protein n=1 Tax=Rhizobium sp. C4 TaxID=1349800 RepID=UPI001E5DBBFE|nr:phosphatidylglycerol lysyltransferase domain-containing protein [Rhizobium sp. C4]MCD2175599.1 phosphatidylglycerol lysyltransferase domain-containing protein [Rhizobium sp. C4]